MRARCALHWARRVRRSWWPAGSPTPSAASSMPCAGRIHTPGETSSCGSWILSLPPACCWFSKQRTHNRVLQPPVNASAYADVPGLKATSYLLPVALACCQSLKPLLMRQSLGAGGLGIMKSFTPALWLQAECTLRPCICWCTSCLPRGVHLL